MKTLKETMEALGLTILPVFNAGMQRKGADWFTGKEIDINGVQVQIANFGNWKLDVKGEWKSENSGTVDKKALQAELDTILAEEQAEREKEWEEVAKEAEELWLSATDRGTHPYIENKKLRELHGARVHVNKEGHPVLLVPMRDSSGKLWNVTRIYTKTFSSDEGDKRGNKFVLKGGKKQGLFHVLGQIHPASRIYFCEGYATGASVFEATGQVTVICFDAGNLGSVAESIRGSWPNCTVVFAADNDLWTTRKNGLPWNPGREKALAAAASVGGTVVLPKFTAAQLEAHPTDWNDLHCLASLSAVTEQLNNPNASIDETVPLVPEGKGARARVPERDISSALLHSFGDNIVAYEHDLFIYKDEYWHLVDESERNRIKQMICRLAPGYGARDVEGALKYFIMNCPRPPQFINMFQPNPFTANFANGTLHISRQGGGYKAEFLPHYRENYLTSKLPFDFPGIPGANFVKQTNPEFEAMLQAVWRGDTDIDDKIRLYKQVLGACLIPLFPTVVLFQGKPGTGKSTLIKILRHLVSPQNISTVDPSDFHGFLMEGMIGKLVNVNTDIDLVAPMKDAMVKKIIDRVPIQINRKFQKAVFGYLPAVHVFAANNLPKTLDGESRAYERRMVILKTESFQAGADCDKEFDLSVWEAGPAGIVCAAVEGLFDLVSSKGTYLQIESGKALVREMQNRNDPIAMFLKNIAEGEVKSENHILSLGPELRIERRLLWESFEKWRDEQDRVTQGIGRNQMLRMLEQKGYETVKVRGFMHVKGLGVHETPGALF